VKDRDPSAGPSPIPSNGGAALNATLPEASQSISTVSPGQTVLGATEKKLYLGATRDQRHDKQNDRYRWPVMHLQRFGSAGRLPATFVHIFYLSFPTSLDHHFQEDNNG